MKAYRQEIVDGQSVIIIGNDSRYMSAITDDRGDGVPGKEGWLALTFTNTPVSKRVEKKDKPQAQPQAIYHEIRRLVLNALDSYDDFEVPDNAPAPGEHRTWSVTHRLGTTYILDLGFNGYWTNDLSPEGEVFRLPSYHVGTFNPELFIFKGAETCDPAEVSEVFMRSWKRLGTLPEAFRPAMAGAAPFEKCALKGCEKPRKPNGKYCCDNHKLKAHRQNKKVKALTMHPDQPIEDQLTTQEALDEALPIEDAEQIQHETPAVSLAVEEVEPESPANAESEAIEEIKPAPKSKPKAKDTGFKPMPKPRHWKDELFDHLQHTPETILSATKLFPKSNFNAVREWMGLWRTRNVLCKGLVNGMIHFGSPAAFEAIGIVPMDSSGNVVSGIPSVTENEDQDQSLAARILQALDEPKSPAMLAKELFGSLAGYLTMLNTTLVVLYANGEVARNVTTKSMILYAKPGVLERMGWEATYYQKSAPDVRG